MKSLKKLLISAIILIVIGFLGLGTLCVLGFVSSGITNYGAGRGYIFGQEDFCNMGRNSTSSQEDKNLSFEAVRDLSQTYIEKYDQNLKIAEIMEFSKNYYVEIAEEDTGIGAMELLVDKSTGSVFPEYGPNMMWNLKYGMHSMMNASNAISDMSIDEEKAIDIATSYLAKSGTNEYAGDEAERFYGHYTIHTTDKDSNILGMLSVNGFSGDVWYHSWHGVFFDMQEYN